MKSLAIRTSCNLAFRLAWDPSLRLKNGCAPDDSA